MMPTDFAIVISVSDFFASFHASIASPSELIASLMPPMIPFALSPTDLIPSRKLFTEARMPTLSPPVIKSFIRSGSKLLKASFAPFAKSENAVSASFPKEESTGAMVWINPVINAPSASNGLKASAIEETKSPMLAVMPKRRFPIGSAALKISAIVLTTVFSAFTPTRITENTPSKVFLIFSAVSSVMMSFSVSRSNRSAMV